MLEVSRTVRFCVSTYNDWRSAGNGVRRNGHGGSPAMHGLGAFYELVVTCRGEPNRVTGYLTGISNIDVAVRAEAVPRIADAFAASEHSPPIVLRELLDALQARLQGILASVQWRLTPYYWLTMHAADPETVLVSQQFEFSAAHRLHCEQLGDNLNRQTFGKCNNPSGHGHNYHLQTTVAVSLDQSPFDARTIERIVIERVIDRFDHKHLNLDTEEFARLNPSVEHITKVCHDLLRDPIAAAGASLQRVTVWETEKTSCTYPAGC